MIQPGEAWDLDHVDGSRSEYAGPAHAHCNRQAGAKNGAAVTNAHRRDAHAGYVNRWSRVWSWPIPPDTYVDPNVVEEYLREERSRARD